MSRSKPLLVLIVLILGSKTVLASVDPDRQDCIRVLTPYKEEQWCNSSDRESCIELHGAEWCDDSTALTAEIKALDKSLNKTYRAVLKTLDEQGRKSLRDSQRLWLQYHRAECDARYNAIGVGDPLMRTNGWQGCINDYFKQRITELKKYFCQNPKECD
ncbi:MAG: DUF1311 domain-containing protein [Geobacter sp.]|nr:DUF1311 domain-containing protein [Geobacter sp.]